MIIAHDMQIKNIEKTFEEFKNRIDETIKDIAKDIKSISNSYNQISLLIVSSFAIIPIILYILEKIGPAILRIMK